MMKEESDKVFCVTEEGSGAAVEYSPVCGQIWMEKEKQWAHSSPLNLSRYQHYKNVQIKIFIKVTLIPQVFC